jgi:hypothetical protein
MIAANDRVVKFGKTGKHLSRQNDYYSVCGVSRRAPCRYGASPTPVAGGFMVGTDGRSHSRFLRFLPFQPDGHPNRPDIIECPMTLQPERTAPRSPLKRTNRIRLKTALIIALVVLLVPYARRSMGSRR